jgi:outer membrane murein-binding lipoprotein Lpp
MRGSRTLESSRTDIKRNSDSSPSPLKTRLQGTPGSVHSLREASAAGIGLGAWASILPRVNGATRERMLTRLQQEYGNTYVQRVVMELAAPRALGPVIQRQQPGWSDSPPGGWNLSETSLEAAKKQGFEAYRRIPIEGLKQGNQADDVVSSTTEKAAGKAIVLLPHQIELERTTEVLLYFHGHNVGFRQKGKDGIPKDVEDGMARQIQNSVHPMIGVMPQGTTRSRFGKDFKSDSYIDEVFDKLVAVGIIPKKPKETRVVLAGHSGGGAILAEMLRKGGKATPPANMGGLFLYDAINGPNELAANTNWVLEQLNHDLNQLTQTGLTPDEQLNYLKTSLRYRAYHTLNKLYADLHKKLKTSIDDWFSKHAKQLGGKDSIIYQALRSNYQVINVGHYDHNAIIKRDDRLKEAIQSLSPVETKVQRAPPPAPPAAPAVDPVQAQWDADWADPAFAHQRNYFNETSRPSGTPQERYKKLCPMYQAHGITRPLKYIADNIVTAKFYHFSTPAHKDLKTALTAAETTLKAAGHAAAPVSSAWALTVRSTSEGGWSNHAAGKAIDFDPGDNPHLTNKQHRKVITALTGYDIAKANPGDALGMSGYESSLDASKIFMLNYNSSGMTQRITELKTSETQLKAEQTAIQTELDAVPKGRKATKADRAKAKEIRTRLSQKKAELKKVTDQRKLLEKELKKYDDLDTAITKLTESVTQLQQDIVALEAALQAAEPKKKPPIQKKLTAKRKELKKAEKKLTAKEKQRDNDTLRKYAEEGFLNLPEDVVNAMKTAGFDWGGDWKGAKDFMHFQIP